MALRKNSREGRSSAPKSRPASKRSESKFSKSPSIEARHKREGEEKKDGKFRKPGKFAKPDYTRDSRFEKPRTENRNDGENRNPREERFKRPGKFAKPEYTRDSRFEKPAESRSEGENRNPREERFKRPGKFSKDKGVNWDDRKKGDKKTPYTKHTRHERLKTEGKEENPKFPRPGKFSKEEKFAGRTMRENTYGKEKANFPKEENTDAPVQKFAAKRAEKYNKPTNSREANFAKTGRFGKPKTEIETAEKRDTAFDKKPRFDKTNSSRETTEKREPRNRPTGLKKNDKEKVALKEEMRLNRFLANGGISSRRDADLAIEKGYVEVNGKVVTELGSKVQPTDIVTYKGKRIYGEKKVYFVLNKPRDTISTMHDPEGRKTVMDMMADACEERIFPVGRLDRNTTGILIFTNDGELSQKLTHPSFSVKKIYEAVLDKQMTHSDMQQLADGIELEDGPIQADNIGFNDETKKSILIEIHSGKNHIIHRMFEHLGYKVEALDRVFYAGLTKKGIKRGQFKEINAKDLNLLRKSCGIKPSKF